MRYTINADHMTVIAHDLFGGQVDLNAHGEPCSTWKELREFVHELYKQGEGLIDDDGSGYGMPVQARDDLLLEIDALCDDPAARARAAAVAAKQEEAYEAEARAADAGSIIRDRA